MVAECKLGLEDRAQPQALNHYHKVWSHSFADKLGQSFAPTFILELMGAGLRCSLASCNQTCYKDPKIAAMLGRNTMGTELYCSLMRSTEDVMHYSCNDTLMQN